MGPCGSGSVDLSPAGCISWNQVDSAAVNYSSCGYSPGVVVGGGVFCMDAHAGDSMRVAYLALQVVVSGSHSQLGQSFWWMCGQMDAREAATGMPFSASFVRDI